jgi:hypothetical protein
MADELRRLAIETRKRAVGSIMTYIETTDWYPRLPVGQQKDLRDKILAGIGTYHDLVLDIIKVGHNDTMVNEETLRIIQLVHEGQRRLEQVIGAR